MFNSWWFYLIIALSAGVVFSLFFKIATKSMKNPSAFIILLQLIAASVSLLFIPFFEIRVSSSPKIWFLFLGACCFVAISRRINTVLRREMYPSVFNIIKRIATVFLIIFGIIFLGESVLPLKVLGSVIIIFSSIFVFYEKGNIAINKYFWFAILGNFIYSIGQMLNISISKNFNLGIYQAILFLVPSIFIFIFGKVSFKDLKNEFSNTNRKKILIIGTCWAISSFCLLRAYQLGDVTVVSPLYATTVVLNLIAGYLFLGERKNLLKKIIATVLIVISVILINW